MTLLTRSPTTRFDSPDDTTAPEPPEFRGLRRDGVRLLVGHSNGIEHTRFDDLAAQVRPGDVLVVNTSATLPGQLDGQSSVRGDVVVHVANRLPSIDKQAPTGQIHVVELRTAPSAADPVLDGVRGELIRLAGGAEIELVDPYPTMHDQNSAPSPTGSGQRLWRAHVHTTEPVQDYLYRHARPISYGYLNRSFALEHYQTVFALCPGSAEMPSAGRPFTTDLVTRLVSQGVLIAPITLHTGVSSQESHEAPQSEWFEVSPATAQLVNAARSSGGRVIAVGTTATRALESAAAEDGTLAPRRGWTDLVISPDRPVRVVQGLITGWHNPEASHLLLVESVAGPELTQRAYDEAVREKYLWHEFGDSALLLPDE